MKRLAVLALGCFVPAFSAAQAEELEGVNLVKVEQWANLMPPIGPNGPSVRTVLDLRVASGGCTKSEDFEYEISQTSRSSEVRLKIVRKTPDYCQAHLPEGEMIQIETNRLPVDPVIILENPQYVIKNYVH